MTRSEFDIIDEFFLNQPIKRNDVMLGIGDDGAIVTAPSDHQIVITTDTLVAGVHFPLATSAYDIGYKSLAVNLSDLAAMGATPAWITLALTFPEPDLPWLKSFSAGVFALAEKYRVQLIGGDITRGPLTITIQAHGFIPNGQAIKRSGAQPGDLIYVADTLGDAAFALQNKLAEENAQVRLNRPEPQVELGIYLRQIANAAIDISDGLAADLAHILNCSAVGAIVYVDQIPLSNALLALPQDQALSFALSGGDDYVLCFTVPAEKKELLAKIANLTCIGIITEKRGLDLRFENGSPYNRDVFGYRHFS